MSYFPETTQERLTSAFKSCGLSLIVKQKYFLVENSAYSSIQRILDIVKETKFCPLISEKKMDKSYAFTLSPYQIPSCFTRLLSPIFPQQIHSSTYFTTKEIRALLESKRFLNLPKKAAFCPWNPRYNTEWAETQAHRSLVLSSFNKGLLDLISKYRQRGGPIVEIGSGADYHLSFLAQDLIRTQPSASECQIFFHSTLEPIYQINSNDLCTELAVHDKKVSLFFALNVFDTFSPELRQKTFLQISQLQNLGDHLLILLDLNPCLNQIFSAIDALYPDCSLFPFYPLGTACEPFSLIPIPMKFLKEKNSLDTLVFFIKKESQSTMEGYPSKLQKWLHKMQKEFNIPVIALEQFFADSIQPELEKVGYSVRTFYNTSFTLEAGEPFEGLPIWQSDLSTDVVYRSVSDTVTLRKWRLTSQDLLTSLLKKGIHLPSCSPNALETLRSGKKQLVGAEFFVIEGRKLSQPTLSYI